ncbi:MAG: IPTL-CTERM sorting domain-containing protein [Bacteroidia bacterium]|nr:IPTL-CTERM sorting domain-containing protein [Bacteroidia bacterium]
MNSSIKLGFALFFFFLWTFQSSANPIPPPASENCDFVTNGDFENGLTGWTGGYSPTATDNVGLFHVAGGNPGAAMELNAPPFPVYANQTINTEAGVTYTVTGDYKGGALYYICPSSGVALRVLADGVTLDDFSYNPAEAPEYAPFSTTFTATGPSTVLTLVGQAVGDCSVVVDNVEVCGPEIAPIPTMSQWALFILGLCMTTLAVVTIRRRVLVVS